MKARLARQISTLSLSRMLVEIGGVAGLFGGFLLVGEPFGVFGLEVVVGIAEERFGGGDEFGIVVAETKNAAFVGRGGHGVHVSIVGKARVSVIVVDGDGIDFGEEPFVEFGEGCRTG